MNTMITVRPNSKNERKRYDVLGFALYTNQRFITSYILTGTCAVLIFTPGDKSTQYNYLHCCYYFKNIYVHWKTKFKERQKAVDITLMNFHAPDEMHIWGTIFCRGFMFYLNYLYLFTYAGVQHDFYIIETLYIPVTSIVNSDHAVEAYMVN
jgi:hypothetical protein